MGKKKKSGSAKKGKKAPSKSKHKISQVWTKYKDGKIDGRSCPRCGPGIVLAKHNLRTTCGKCGYSEIKKKPETPKKE